VLAAGTRYLTIVGPFYGFFGAGLALYFASQGAGRLLWPLCAGFTRLVVAGAGGWLAVRGLGGGLPGLYVTMAAALVVLGVMNIAAIHLGAWRARDGRGA
jgi:Na+-driven multidrug efflux pump